MRFVNWIPTGKLTHPAHLSRTWFIEPVFVDKLLNEVTIGEPQENGGLMGFNGIHLLVICCSSLVNMTIEIVDFPIWHGDFPQLCQSLPEGNLKKGTCSMAQYRDVAAKGHAIFKFLSHVHAYDCRLYMHIHSFTSHIYTAIYDTYHISDIPDKYSMQMETWPWAAVTYKPYCPTEENEHHEFNGNPCRSSGSSVARATSAASNS